MVEFYFLCVDFMTALANLTGTTYRDTNMIILFVFCALFHARSNFSVLKFPLSLLHWIQLKTEQPGLRRSSLGLSLSIRTRGCS